GPKRWRHDVLHEAARHHRIALDFRLRRCLLDLGLPDARRMHIRLVRQIHQVVDHQPIVAFDVVKAAAVGPFGAIGPLERMDLGGIGLRWIAWPYPNEAVPFDDRKPACRWKSAYALARHRYAFAVRPHGEAVIAAHELPVADEAERKRCTSMRTEILECR